MKNLILVVTSLMMVGLIIATFFYSHQSKTIAMPPGVILERQIQQEQMGEPEQPLFAEDTIDYSLQNDELNITFNKGEDWTQVPIDKSALFAGDYNGSEQELIDGSYVLTQNRVAFLHVKGDDREGQKIMLTYSLDQGETWKDSVVIDSFPGIRYRNVDFLNDDFGSIIISGGRTMSQEGSRVFLTHDGGKSWKSTNAPDTTRMVADGGFTDKDTGFVSYGTINPESPDLYVTQDAGDSWKKAEVHVPKKYEQIFVSAETPVKEDDHLAVLLNQGPNGDYQGGEVKGKFISEDNGSTWDFSEEVDPDETDE